MKKILSLLFLLTSFIVTAQQEQATDKKEYTTTQSFKYSVNTIENLEKLNFSDLKKVFKDNKPTDLIEVSFEIDLPKSTNKFKSNVTVGVETKNLDSLIIRLHKIQKKIINISKEVTNK